MPSVSRPQNNRDHRIEILIFSCTCADGSTSSLKRGATSACSSGSKICWTRNGGEFRPRTGAASRRTSRLTRTDTRCREEQHDDQVLHELLRCFKALTMTNVSFLARENRINPKHDQRAEPNSPAPTDRQADPRLVLADPLPSPRRSPLLRETPRRLAVPPDPRRTRPRAVPDLSTYV